jgi:hypothetical protein
LPELDGIVEVAHPTTTKRVAASAAVENEPAIDGKWRRIE